jgi:hypothetical protein
MTTLKSIAELEQDRTERRRKYRRKKAALYATYGFASAGVIVAGLYAGFFRLEDRARRNAVECAEDHGLIPHDVYVSNTGMAWMRLQQGDKTSFVSVAHGACAPQHTLNPEGYMLARGAYLAERRALAQGDGE